jgi:hypothetical protein
LVRFTKKDIEAFDKVRRGLNVEKRTNVVRLEITEFGQQFKDLDVIRRQPRNRSVARYYTWFS